MDRQAPLESVPLLRQRSGQHASSDDDSGPALPGDSTKASPRQATANAVNAMVGPTMLAVPYAFKLGGWSVLPIFVVMAIVFTYTARKLAQCQRYKPGVFLQSYPDVVAAAFGRTGRVLASVVLSCELASLAVGFMILEGTNLEKLQPLAFIGPAFRLTSLQWMGVAWLIVTPTVLAHSYSFLSYLSVAGVAFSAALPFIALGVGLSEGLGSTAHQEAVQHVWFEPSGVPQVAGIIAVALTGHAVFPDMNANMASSNQFSRVIGVSIATTALAYISMGCVCYAWYGQGVASQVTFNFPAAVQTTVSVVVVCIPLLKFALMLNPVCGAAEAGVVAVAHMACPGRATTELELTATPVMTRADSETGPEGARRAADSGGHSPGTQARVVRTVTRLVITVLVVAVAAAMPFFALVTSLTGSMLSLVVCMVFPSACYLRLMWGRLAPAEKVANIAIVLVGVFLAATGTVQAVKDLADKL